MEVLYTIHTKFTYDIYKEYKYKSEKIYQRIARATLLYAIICIGVIFLVYWKTVYLFLQFLLFIPLLLVALFLKRTFQIKKSWQNLLLIKAGEEIRTDFYEGHIEQITEFTKRPIPYEKFCGVVVERKAFI